MPFNHSLLGIGGIPVYEVVISANRGAWKKSVDASSIPSGIKIILRFTVNTSITIQSTISGTHSVTFDSLFAGSEVQVINNGNILGRGGDGNGFLGGHAIRADFIGILRLTNGAGNIWSGGGGGGLGGNAIIWNGADLIYEWLVGGSGGGGGAGGGNGGQRQFGDPPPGSDGADGNAGTAGTSGVGGTGGTTNADGGNGGIYGGSGTNGQGGNYINGPQNGNLYQAGGIGGSPGNAILHNAGTTIIWISGNSSPNRVGPIGT